MPLDLFELASNTRTITVRSEACGVEVEFEVTYAPAEWTQPLQRMCLDAFRNEEVTEGLSKALCQLIKRWDVTFKGKPVPIVPEVFLGTYKADEGFRFPLKLVPEIFNAIWADMNPNPPSSAG
jgi:hypothetical protein